MAKGWMSSRLFWGFMFLLIGILALLQNYGYQIVDLERFWPIFLVVIGLWMMLHHKHCCEGYEETTKVPARKRR